MEKWLEALLVEHIGEDVEGLAAFKEAYDSEAPLRNVPKHVFNETNNELKEARNTLKELQESNDTKELEEKLNDYKEKLEALEQERTDERLNNALSAALADAHDIEFVSSLLKDKVELDEDGNVKGLEDIVKETKEKQPYLFKVEEAKEEPKEPEVVVDNSKLTNTKSTPLTKQDIASIKNKAERLEAIQANPHLYNI